MPINPELAYLTEGYEPVAQMAIELARHLGYVGHADFVIINPIGDDTSAGSPYFADVTYNETDGYQFMSYDASRLLTVNPNYQVLVYRKPPTPVYSVDQQINMLIDLANQFDEDSFLRTFLNPRLIEWLRSNKDNPDIYTEWLRSRDVARRLEENINSFESLYNDNFPY